MTRVGIAIPSYLGAPLIAETLQSVIEQTHPDWFCVVVNDGDEDGAADIVARLGDSRIRYVCDGQRRGQLRNFNKAILEVLKLDPDIVRLLSADDVLYPHNLEDMVRVFNEHPDVGLVACHFDGIDRQGRLQFCVSMDGREDLIMRGRDYLLKGVAVGNTIGGPSSVAIRREAFETAGLFDPRIDFSGDSDLWHRVAAGWDVAWVGDRAGFQYRQHAASVTGRDTYSIGRFIDKIQVVRRVTATEALLGPRWWVHQYTIGWLHAINLQLIAAMARRGRWDGVRTGLAACMREGLLVYLPFWLPRLPLLIVRVIFGFPSGRRVLWRRTHESLQPPRISVQPGDRPDQPSQVLTSTDPTAAGAKKR